jgi:type IX secretion system PorP/SprF family membrane protein
MVFYLLMRKVTILSTALLMAGTVFAQQLHFTSQYLQHNSMYNPAAAGMTDNQSVIGISYRNQWGSFPGNPKTYILYGDFGLKKMKAGLGAYIYRDITGPTSRTGVQLAYSYHVKLNDRNARLGIGLEFRLLQFAIDKSKLTDALGNDPVLSGSSNKIAPDAGAGIYFTNDKLSFGVAASQLIKSKISLGDPTGTDIRAKLYRHYNFMASYKWQTGENVYLIPNGMVRVIENAPPEYDLGCKLDYQEKLWFALNWRAKQSCSVQAGFTILKKIEFGYSFDCYITPSTLVNDGFAGHELSLRFHLK